MTPTPGTKFSSSRYGTARTQVPVVPESATIVDRGFEPKPAGEKGYNIFVVLHLKKKTLWHIWAHIRP